MKKITILYLVALLLSTGSIVSSATVTYPYQGGTGTSTVPTLNQVLMGANGGVYGPSNTINLSTVNASTSQITNLTVTNTLNAATTTISGVVAGNLDLANNLILNIGHPYTDFTSGGGLNLNGTLNASGTSAFTGTSTFSGNVGIGTTSPSYILDVNGQAHFVGTTTFDGNIKMTGATSTFYIPWNATSSWNWSDATNTYLSLHTTAGGQQLVMGSDMAIGTLQISQNSGAVTLVDMPVTSAAASSTEESYCFSIDGVCGLQVYSQANGVGTTTAPTIVIGSSAMGAAMGKLCFWNGLNYTKMWFATSSITPSYATSTNCQY